MNSAWRCPLPDATRNGTARSSAERALCTRIICPRSPTPRKDDVMNRRESLKLIGSAALAATGGLLAPAWAQAPAGDGPFKLPPLGYPFEALEPHIDAQTMMIHHER